MANINCAISGIKFSCEHLPITVATAEGYYHPIFALPQKKLLPLFSKHCQGHLTPTDSYLLFLAYLWSTEQVEFNVPASCPPTSAATAQLVEQNLRQLIEVIELTACISTPHFKQPSYTVYKDNSLLEQVPNWIAAWNSNIEDFRTGYREQRLEDAIKKAENRLTQAILSGEEPHRYAQVIASWAAKAGDFPRDKSELYQKTIRSCFNSEKMFSTPLPLLKEIKEYCEVNIEVGSIHFHTLYETLKEGIGRHTNFLELSPSSLGDTYLLPEGSSLNDIELAAIRKKAPESAPKRTEYATDVDFLRAKLRYAVSSQILATEGEES